MNRIVGVGIVCAVAIVLAMATALLVVLPAQVLKQTQFEFLSRTGKTLNIAGGTSIRLSPQFGIALNDVSVAGGSAQNTDVFQARAIFVPVSLKQVFGLSYTNEIIIVETPIFTVAINSEGRSNILLSDTSARSKADMRAALPTPLQLRFQNGNLVYSDEAHANSFALSEAEGLIAVDAQQEITLKSAAVLGRQRVHVQSVLHSLPRAFAEGSPFDFNLDGAGASFGYSGRLVVKNGVELAGQATVDTEDVSRLFKWLGMDLHGLQGKHTLAMTSAVETQGALVLMKKADVKFADMAALGDISFFGAAARPSLTFDLALDEINTNLFSPVVNRISRQGIWNDKKFDLSDLKALDVSFKIAARRVRFGDFISGEALIDGALKDGVANAAIKSETSGNADINFDSVQSPPKLSINLDLKNIEAKTFMRRFAGMNWLQGPLRLNASLMTEGSNQAEMVGGLKGNAEIQFDQAQIQGVELAGLAAHVQTENVSGWEGQMTDPVTGNAKFSLADGVATLQENEITAPGLKAIQNGEIDILRQALNLESAVGLNRGDGNPMTIKITGSWANPNFALTK